MFAFKGHDIQKDLRGLSLIIIYYPPEVRRVILFVCGGSLTSGQLFMGSFQTALRGEGSIGGWEYSCCRLVKI